MVTRSCARMSAPVRINIWTAGHLFEGLTMIVSLMAMMSRTYGYDRSAGGFYDSGSFHGSADRREKVLWVQAEGLVAALQMYRLTGEEVYWNCFSQTLEWIAKYQANWEHGDWYEWLSSDGRPAALQDHIWKSPYHNGRAMIYCL